MKLSTRAVVATGIGAAVFLILFKFVAIPTGIPNTQINVAEAWLSLITAIFGPLVGGLVAFIGHSLNDAISYGSIWWSWVIADAFYAVILGFGTRRLKLADGDLTKSKLVWFNIEQLIANIVAWSIIAPLGDIVIYNEPANKVFLQGFVATGVNFISTLILGTLLLVAYNKTRVKRGSLNKED
ncbi:MAG: ECF-type riboflavin transporter substrate-binding protein [Lactobacillaceae bacterium]|jgi:energy-coupling factor transport system substrate-specific component|nr:ECF-type riboflavin transporter substrate-binding protein [Lactobacillaceae bacterium]